MIDPREFDKIMPPERWSRIIDVIAHAAEEGNQRAQTLLARYFLSDAYGVWSQMLALVRTAIGDDDGTLIDKLEQTRQLLEGRKR